MGRHILVTMTNPVDGREDEFNDWYSNVHLSESVGVPGLISAQRFKLSDEQLGEPSEYRYLAIYEIEAESAGAARGTQGGTTHPQLQRRTRSQTRHAGLRSDLGKGHFLAGGCAPGEHGHVRRARAAGRAPRPCPW